ncbi:RNase H-like domain found in reverse transcriptase [Popillia japonica]|uniref:RNase H-like domain found in reverse transcriptase n=1 Tax=Popillia japonica TaxID=7064 RepID=A0AAW1JDG2_POPJA
MDKWPPSEEEKKIRILFTLIGDKAMFKYDRFKLSDDEKTTVNNVISAIRSRLISKRNVIYERAMFNSCNQETDEKFDDYYRKLEKLIDVIYERAMFNSCNQETDEKFDDYYRKLEKLIENCIKNKELRKRLMIKADLTLRETLDLCRIDELTNQQMQELSTETVNKISNARSCKFCGNLHSFTKGACPAFGQVCRSCGGKNHFQKVCKKKKGKKEQIEAKVEKKSRRKKIKSVEGINKAWKKLSCQLDTGANVNLIGYNYLCKIFNTDEFKIKKSQHKLYSFGGGLQVVNVEHGILLSVSACVSMGLINYCNTIMERNLKDEAQSIITKYKNVFEGYGCFGNEARLETNPEVKPVLQYPRHAIQKLTKPKNKEELLRFLGMLNYLSRYIKDLSSKVIHLRKLTHQNIEWKWTDVENCEFENVKECVASAPTLKYFNVNEPVIIECDASDYGLGVALYQNNAVIGYASRTLTKTERNYAQIEKETLTKTERNYAQIEKELLAVVFACIRFDQLITANPKVTVKTDHKPLLSMLQLQRYNLYLEFISGKNNKVADTLSRTPVTNNKMEVYEIIDKQLQNFENVNIKKQILVERFFKHATSAPNHQQENGKAEATVKIAKNLIKKVEEENGDIGLALLHVRNTPNKIGFSPTERLFSRNTRTTIPTIKRNLLPKPIADVTKHIENQRRLSKGYYDRNTRKYPDLKIGQPVSVQVDGKIWSKGNIKEKLPDNSYIVKVDENCYRRSEVNVKPRQETEESTSDKETTQNDTHNKLTMPPESEDVSSKPATTRQSETTPATRDPEEAQLDEDLQTTRPSRRRHLPLKYKDFVM